MDSRRTYAAAYTRNGAQREKLDDIVVGAFAGRRIQIDHLNLRKAREFIEHLERRIAFQRLLATLNKLHYFAAHHVDARNDHCGGLTGTFKGPVGTLAW